MQSVFLHPTAAALAKLLPSPSEAAAESSEEPTDQWTEDMEDGTSPKLETSTSAVLACAAPVLFFFQYLWTVLSGIASLITLLFVVDIVGWPGILPLLFVMLFLSEIFAAITSAALLTCLKWLLVRRLRPSDASAGPQRLAFSGGESAGSSRRNWSPPLRSSEDRSSRTTSFGRLVLVSPRAQDRGHRTSQRAGEASVWGLRFV